MRVHLRELFSPRPITVALLISTALGLPAGAAEPTAEALFTEVWERVRQDFYDPALRGVDWEEARQRYGEEVRQAPDLDAAARAINGMLAELGTSHTRFYTRDEPALHELLDLFSAGPLGGEIAALYPGGEVSYPGIGVFTRELPEGLFVSGVLEGGPAAASGLLVGDRLLTVAGEPFHPIRSFRGRVGESLALRVERARPGDGEPGAVLTLTVVPARIRPGELFLDAMRASARIIEREGVKVAAVHAWSYAGEQYQDLLVELVTGDGPLAGADALVLDIRDGWGGANPDYLSLFDRQVPSLTQIPRHGEPSTFDRHWRRPVALLVNGGTRSGKELLAHGFQRHGIGPVVGTRTAGAVVAGRPYLLSGGHLLFLAVADVRVDGERLEGRGVQPDVEVAFPLPWAAGQDPQMEAAVAAMVAAVRHRPPP